MYKNNKGFSILLALFITTGLSLLVLNLWYRTSLFFDIVLQKEQYYKNFFITKVGLNYSISLIKNNFDFIENKLKEKEIVLDLTDLMKNSETCENKNLSLRVNISKYKDSVNFLLSAKLYNLNKLEMNLACLVERVLQNNQEDNNASISQNKSKYLFVIKDFTISPIF